MTLKAADVEVALEAKYEDEGSYFWDELEWLTRDTTTVSDSEPDHKTLEVNGKTYPLTVVEEDTGGEGHGEDVYVVVKVGDQLFRKSGYYASHHGTDWDGRFEEVEAFQKKVTFFRKV